MRTKREVIEIHVSRRILWIGASAYPLHNIARARTIMFRPDRAKAAWNYVFALVAWIVLAVAAKLALDYVREHDAKLVWLDSHGDQVSGGIVLAAAILVLISSISFLSVVLRRTYYGLIIETAGPPQTAFVSDDGDMVSSLVQCIMNAVDNPYAEFHHTVENIHIGHNISQSGDHNTMGAIR